MLFTDVQKNRQRGFEINSQQIKIVWGFSVCFVLRWNKDLSFPTVIEAHNKKIIIITMINVILPWLEVCCPPLPSALWALSPTHSGPIKRNKKGEEKEETSVWSVSEPGETTTHTRRRGAEGGQQVGRTIRIMTEDKWFVVTQTSWACNKSSYLADPSQLRPTKVFILWHKKKKMITHQQLNPPTLYHSSPCQLLQDSSLSLPINTALGSNQIMQTEGGGGVEEASIHGGLTRSSWPVNVTTEKQGKEFQRLSRCLASEAIHCRARTHQIHAHKHTPAQAHVQVCVCRRTHAQSLPLRPDIIILK